MSSPKVIISGGGTGGHIFPAIAIANALKEINPSTDILFVGANGRMEMEKVPAAGYPIEGLWISGLQRKLTLKNLAFPFKLMSSLMRSGAIINRFQPDVAVGVGGFASGPLLKMATRKKVPTLIQEQNSYPGITNKLLGGKVKKVCVAYDGMERFFPKEKIILTGNPVRKEVVMLEGKRQRALEHFHLQADRKTLLVIGGSLGARSINEAIRPCLETFRQRNIQLIWQTGKNYVEEARVATAGLEESGIKAHTFIEKMDYAYAAADLVVSRAGAIAVSELCLTAKPCVLVPFPYAAEDHQTKNAMALVNHHAALLVKDTDAGEQLGPLVLDLMENDEKRDKLAAQISGLGFEDSARVIANEVLKLIEE
ncbi:MAG: undecaprenyldiphospho-muramoylpentapeptide beta-N-acetylglucosaminyltransferase [Salibacteraceae bacterium]